MRRALRVLPWVALLTAVVEIAVFVLIGRGIGYGWAMLLVVAASAVGLLLLRREGMRAWRGFRQAAREARPPGDQVSDGLVGLGAGLLLAVPGLVSGAVGLFLLLPAVRRRVRHQVRALAERRMSSMTAGNVFGPRRVRVYRGEPARPGAPFERVPPPDAAAGGRPIEGEIVPPGRS